MPRDPHKHSTGIGASLCQQQERQYTDGWRERVAGKLAARLNHHWLRGWRDADRAIKAGRVKEAGR